MDKDEFSMVSLDKALQDSKKLSEVSSDEALQEDNEKFSKVSSDKALQEDNEKFSEVSLDETLQEGNEALQEDKDRPLLCFTPDKILTGTSYSTGTSRKCSYCSIPETNKWHKE